MNQRIEQAKDRLERAKEMYRRHLRGIDSFLKSVAAQDPANIPAVKAVQASYADHGFQCEDMAELLQPAGVPVAEPMPIDPPAVVPPIDPPVKTEPEPEA